MRGDTGAADKLSNDLAVGSTSRAIDPGDHSPSTDLILGFEEALSHPPRVPGRLHVAGAVGSWQGPGDICGGSRAPNSCISAGRMGDGRASFWLPFFSPSSVGISYSTISFGAQAFLGSAGAWGGGGVGGRGCSSECARHLGSSLPAGPAHVSSGTQRQARRPHLALPGPRGLQRRLLLPQALLFGFAVPPGGGGPIGLGLGGECVGPGETP